MMLCSCAPMKRTPKYRIAPPNPINIERKRQTTTKIPEAIWVNISKSSADDNFAKHVIAFYLHS